MFFSKSSLGARGRDKILLDAPWPDLTYGGVFIILRRTHRAYTWNLPLMWNQEGNSLAVNIQTCSVQK